MAELPSGTVTFLFSDVEGSTRLLGRLRDGYGAVLADHRRLLRASFAENDGQEIDVQGDAFFVVFRRAKDAAAAAVSAQRALAAHSWPQGGELRVRMGLHTGEPSVGEDGYLGLAVHRAARICAAGSGGQVLLSQSTCAVLEDDELTDASLKDLGEHQLKDFDRSERIYQLVVDGLPSDFAPLKALDSQPVKATPFAGHESELAAAAQAAVTVRRRRRVLETATAQFRRRAAHWRASIILFPHAARRTVTKPVNIVVQAAVVAVAIAVQPWLAAVGLVFYALLVWSAISRLRVSSLEVTGWRLRMASRIASDDRLRGQVSALASAIIRAAQACASVDQYLKTVNRRRLAHRLHEHREIPVVSQDDLDAADALARQIAALDALAEQRRALGDESKQLASAVTALPERLYRARLDTTSAKGLSADVGQIRGRIDALRMQLDEASDLARRYDTNATRRGRSHWRRFTD